MRHKDGEIAPAGLLVAPESFSGEIQESREGCGSQFVSATAWQAQTASSVVARNVDGIAPAAWRWLPSARILQCTDWHESAARGCPAALGDK